MRYRRDKKGREISVLGYGCMRFTQKAGGIDIDKAEKEIMAAYEGGVNYYDTAYIYPGSEAAIGEIFERNGIRDKINIATKLPHYLIRGAEGLDKTFKEELRRLRTDRVDYYLMHMLNDVSAWERLKGLGIEEWIGSKKASGEIINIGYSYHGNSDMFCRLIDVYDWDFCQIQYNYLDENSQAGRTGLEYAASKGIPVVIMEPLRGGRLVNGLPSSASQLIKERMGGIGPAEASFRWLWDQPGVTCVLSGMNTLESVQQNLSAADRAEAGSISREERELYDELVRLITASQKVGCTGCRYCMPCPKNVDIPGIFAAYNASSIDGRMRGIRDYFMTTAVRGSSTGASNCIGCGRCEQHCPQYIEIRKELKNAKKALEIPGYGIGVALTKRFMRYS
ncbi:MAG: aldo/keto reductase [Firmicutes bacterium]|nr:aldo/keto reductase [Bacillota bacterium]